MTFAPEVLLVGAVIGVGILHTIVPDHWVPITLIARQRGWTRAQTASAALKAGTGHVVSTLLIGVVVWVAGVAFATRFGTLVSTISSLALIAFGAWIAIGALREMRTGHGHSHAHGHSHEHGHDHDDAPTGDDGDERQTIATPDGPLMLSIFERGTPPRFRVSGASCSAITAELVRADGTRETFPLTDRGPFFEGERAIPEPHEFDVVLSVTCETGTDVYQTRFEEHDHAHHAAPAAKTSSRTALLLILGSSPMVEGIPAFFAAAKYGPVLIILMSLAFGISTIATYVLLCTASTAGLQRVKLGAFERYGEVISGAFIALVGLVFLIFPVL